MFSLAASKEFIEQRRRALRRFLNLVVRHPVITDDPIVAYFLTFQGSVRFHCTSSYVGRSRVLNVGFCRICNTRLRSTSKECQTSSWQTKAHWRPRFVIGTSLADCFQAFVINSATLRRQELVSLDVQQQFGNSKDHLRKLTENVTKLREISERMTLRMTGYAADMLQLGRELGSMSTDSPPVSTWACGTNKTWEYLRKGFKPLSVEYAKLAEKSSQHVRNAELCKTCSTCAHRLRQLHSRTKTNRTRRVVRLLFLMCVCLNSLKFRFLKVCSCAESVLIGCRRSAQRRASSKKSPSSSTCSSHTEYVAISLRSKIIFSFHSAVVHSFQDLCERQEKNVVTDHQKALQKMQSYKRKKMSATLQGNEGVRCLLVTREMAFCGRELEMRAGSAEGAVGAAHLEAGERDQQHGEPQLLLAAVRPARDAAHPTPTSRACTSRCTSWPPSRPKHTPRLAFTLYACTVVSEWRSSLSPCTDCFSWLSCGTTFNQWFDNLLPRDINKNNPAATSGNGVTSSIHRSQSQPSSAWRLLSERLTQIHTPCVAENLYRG